MKSQKTKDSLVEIKQFNNHKSKDRKETKGKTNKRIFQVKILAEIREKIIGE